MRPKVQKYTPEQMELVSELTQDYGIEPEQIRFYNDDPKPTFDVEAGAVLARTLAGAKGISVGSVASQTGDTISMECGIKFEDFYASAIGSANVNEHIDGEVMSPQQLERLAGSRAMRSALVFAGIDLVKLHRQRRSGVAQFTGPDKSGRVRLLSSVHALGKEVGFISPQGEKTLWERMLTNRYGVNSSGTLTDELLEDLAAFLRSIRPSQIPVAKKAA